MSKRYAVLDTSFWRRACNLGLDPFLPDVFHCPIFIPEPVYREIVDFHWRGQYQYPDQKRMKLWVEDRRVVVWDKDLQTTRGTHFGEGFAISLALHFRMVLLVDDVGAWRAARAFGVMTMSTPEFIVLLEHMGVWNRSATHYFLERALTDGVSKAIIKVAEASLEAFRSAAEEVAPHGESNRPEA